MQADKKHTKKHIVFLGENGFPKGLAAIQRMTLMARSLVYVGYATTVICRKGIWRKGENEEIKTKGVHEGIAYIYTSKSTVKPSGFINRNIQKLKGLSSEYRYLKQLKKQNKLHAAIVSNMSAFHLLRYTLYSALLKFPVVLNFVEMASAMQDRKSKMLRINDYLVDKWIIKFFDATLPISDTLFNYYETVCPSKPCMKLPILCDFKKFDIQANKQDSYFLYCGSIAYREVIDFVIKAYKSADCSDSTKLYMIISGGSKEETRILQTQLNKGFTNESVRLFSNIPYEQLIALYTNAKALLIPLRPTVQDASRFPHKIGEYLASGNPVITTAIGEIKNYFEDGKTALIADNYFVDEVASKMHFVLKNPAEAEKIGLNGKHLGLRKFHYEVHGSRLHSFFIQNKFI